MKLHFVPKLCKLLIVAIMHFCTTAIFYPLGVSVIAPEQQAGNTVALKGFIRAEDWCHYFVLEVLFSMENDCMVHLPGKISHQLWLGGWQISVEMLSGRRRA